MLPITDIPNPSYRQKKGIKSSWERSSEQYFADIEEEENKELYLYIGYGTIRFSTRGEAYLHFNEFKKVLHTATNVPQLRDRYLSLYGGHLNTESISRTTYSIFPGLSGISQDEISVIKSLGGMLYLSRNRGRGTDGIALFSTNFYFSSSVFRESNAAAV